MFKFTKYASVKYNALDVFDVILDVERYHEFVPCCKAIKIIKHGKDVMFARTLIGIGVIRVQYISKIFFIHPAEDNFGIIRIEANNGPFKYLSSEWNIIATDEYSSVIHFQMEFDFKSPFFSNTFQNVFQMAQKNVVDAFVRRVNKLLGS